MHIYIYDRYRPAGPAPPPIPLPWHWTMALPLLLLGLSLATGVPAVTVPRLEIAPGVHLPWVQLGACTHDPAVSLGQWLDAQPEYAAVDTAFGYGDQRQLASLLAKAGRPRESLWLTSKIPGGLAKVSPCTAADPEASALQYVRDDLEQLNVSFVDLMLLHEPCDMKTGKATPADLAIWRALSTAVAKGYARAIGVDRMLPAQIEPLLAVHKPAIHMASMTMTKHKGEAPGLPGDPTIAWCEARGINFNAFGVMGGCMYSAPEVKSLSAKYSVSGAQICGAWTRQRGFTMAVSSGCNASTAAEYTRENLGIFSFNLTAGEVENLSNLE
jgi:2,5-diketo-D-gluconate reductase A